MNGTSSMHLTPLSLTRPSPPLHLVLLSNPPKLSILTCIYSHGVSLSLRPETPSLGWSRLPGPTAKKKKRTQLRASRRESPYEVLGVPTSADPREIKRAYRRLALKYHPDVNKEANAQERFMRIKHAYNTLLNSDSQFKNDFSNQNSSYSRTSGAKRNQTTQEEDFYGFGNFLRDVQITIADFFQDLQAEFQNWEADINSQEKPKSLWEELADIGEEFVEFLEKELNINDLKSEDEFDSKEEAKVNFQDEGNKESKIEESIDEIEATLAQLKKELGLQ